MIRYLSLFIASFVFSVTVHAQTVDAAFSPDGEAQELIIQTIGLSKESVRIAAYTFTSFQIAQKLVEVKKRGVDVKVIVDERGNRSKASKKAINLIAKASIPVRTVSIYKIHHDKYIVLDGRHIETGSFNFSRAASKSNSENIIVIRDHIAIADLYLNHWQSRWEQGQNWKLEE